MSQKIRIKLKSYDFNLVDKSAEKIVDCKDNRCNCYWANPFTNKKENFYCFKITSR